ncbi:CDP-diacylglycerol--glycerol-3-phosphate 3-phosphatidyltransferase [Candidatus Fermentibacteria bacterium]|nr:CDP-diacylglycerol--glycerol-3-phosphate 3-phosphatidyltransferase [Candidatus Fermentibacteria bacterium]
MLSPWPRPSRAVGKSDARLMPLNWPNRLTILRMILGPASMVMLLDPRPAFRYSSLALFVFAALTDLYDGYLARRYGWVTNLGRFLDPLADKLMVCLALIGLVQIDLVPLWAVWVIIGRELLVTGLRAIAAYAGVLIMPSRLGKWKNASEVVSIIFYLVLALPERDIGATARSFLQSAAWASLLIAVLLAVTSGLDYFGRNRAIMKRLLW